MTTRCAICDERLAPTDERCPVCGTAVPESRTGGPPSRGLRVCRCPRCRFTGEGIPYFRRTGHVWLLAGAAVVSYGVGAVVYYLLRKDSVVCPACGFLWDGIGPLQEGSQGSGASRIVSVLDEPLPSSGAKRRTLGALLMLVSAVSAIVGVARLDLGAVTVTVVPGVVGAALWGWGWSSLRARRAALSQSLERQVLQLASARGGTLTVTDVATSLHLSIAAAERVLHGMDDGFRVTSDVTDEGIVLFQFPEVQLRRFRDGGSREGSEGA